MVCVGGLPFYRRFPQSGAPLGPLWPPVYPRNARYQGKQEDSASLITNMAAEQEVAGVKPESGFTSVGCVKAPHPNHETNRESGHQGSAVLTGLWGADLSRGGGLRPQTPSDLRPLQTSDPFRPQTPSDLRPPQTSDPLRPQTPSDLRPPQTSDPFRPQTPSDLRPPQTSDPLRPQTPSDLRPPQTPSDPLRPPRLRPPSDLSPPQTSDPLRPQTPSDLRPPQTSDPFRPQTPSDLRPLQTSDPFRPQTPSDLRPPQTPPGGGPGRSPKGLRSVTGRSALHNDPPLWAGSHTETGASLLVTRVVPPAATLTRTTALDGGIFSELARLNLIQPELPQGPKARRLLLSAGEPAVSEPIKSQCWFRLGQDVRVTG
ncbi:unnamed protein product [Arctogadus glacialis]